MLPPKDGLGGGKRSSKEAKEAQGLGPDIPLHVLHALGARWGQKVMWGDPSYFFICHPNIFKPKAGLAGGGSSWYSLSWRTLANCFMKHQRVLQNPFPLAHWYFYWADHVY